MLSEVIHWWQKAPSFLSTQHHVTLLKKIQTPPLCLFFYQKRHAYVRLQVIQEAFYFETYLSWERWDNLTKRFSLLLAENPPQRKSYEEAFTLFCREFQLEENIFNTPWVQLFSHGDVPFGIFPAYHEETLWEFFLPAGNHTPFPPKKKHLIIYDESLPWAEKEREMLCSLFSTDVVASDFLFSVVWSHSYTSLHVISHGKNGALLFKNNPVAILPFYVEDLAFFHCCEIFSFSPSLIASLLTHGTRHIIASPTTLIDDGSLLPAIDFFYRIYLVSNARYSFHITSLAYPCFKESFRLVLPYERNYVS